MRKIVVSMRNYESAVRFLEKAKKTSGVRYTQKYMAAGHYHCMVTGDFTEETERELLGRKRNLVELTRRI